VAGKRSRFDVCRISFRKTGVHFFGKCSNLQELPSGELALPRSGLVQFILCDVSGLALLSQSLPFMQAEI